MLLSIVDHLKKMRIGKSHNQTTTSNTTKSPTRPMTAAFAPAPPQQQAPTSSTRRVTFQEPVIVSAAESHVTAPTRKVAAPYSLLKKRGRPASNTKTAATATAGASTSINIYQNQNQQVLPPTQPTAAAENSTTTANSSTTSTDHMSSINYAYATTNLHRKRKSRAPFECIICLTEFKTNIPHGTEKCDHQVCRECVRKYFNGTLKDDRYSSYESIQCPSPGCTEYFVTDEALLYFFSKAEVKRWWNTAVTKSYITNKVSLFVFFWDEGVL